MYSKSNSFIHSSLRAIRMVSIFSVKAEQSALLGYLLIESWNFYRIDPLIYSNN